MSSFRFTAAVAAASLALLALPAVSPAKSSKPSARVVHRLMINTYGQPTCTGDGEICTLTFSSTRVLSGRKKFIRTSGGTAGRITVYPAEVKFRIKVTNRQGQPEGFNHGIHHVDAKIYVYRTEFGSWAYNNVEVTFRPPLA